MANHFSILAWRIPWTEEPPGLQSDMTERLRLSHFRGRFGTELEGQCVNGSVVSDSLRSHGL